MTYDRDIAAFDARADSYESGWRGRLHQQIADRTADLALTLAPQPQRILDVGCGTGYLLRQFAVRCPQAVEVAGVDPAPAMIGAARTAGTDGRLRWMEGTAEELPFPGDPSTWWSARPPSITGPSQQAGAVRPGPGTRRLARAH